MKIQIITQKTAVLILAMFLLIGGIGFSHAHTVSSGGARIAHFEDTSLIEFHIEEALPVGTLVGNPVAAHSLPQHYRYTLEGTSTSVDAFRINASTAQLSTNKVLDFESRMFYDFFVRVEKGIVNPLSDAQSGPIVDTWILADKRPVRVNISDNPKQADSLPNLTSEERLRLISSVRLDTVIFNEIFNASTDTHDWVELRNITDTEIDLSGWTLIVTTATNATSVGFPEGTVLPAGELLLFTNTDPSEPGMPLSTSEAASDRYLVDEAFALPQADFMLLLRSPTEWKDNAGSYLFGHEKTETTVDFTVDTAWSRAKPSVLGHQAEAWVVSGYQGGLGYDSGTPEDISLGTPGHRRKIPGDVNADGVVNILDIVFVASQLGQSGQTPADVNGDNVVNIQDLVMIANGLGGSAAAAPSAAALTTRQVEAWLRLAKQGVSVPSMRTALSQQGFSYERGIEMLENILRTLRPRTTALLSNYPNPFNPETWLPYQLAANSAVQLTIYDARGAVVRQFNLGHQPVGIYQSRSRAVYWDGRNALGESVASGVYFYTLTTEDFSATRRMLILK